MPDSTPDRAIIYRNRANRCATVWAPGSMATVLLDKHQRLGLLLGLGAGIPPLAIYLTVKPPSWEVVGGAAGVAGALFIVMSMVFMLRFSRLTEHVGGLESMYRLHRKFALTGYVLLLIHAFAITGGEWRALNLTDKSWGFIAGWTAVAVFMATIHATFVLRPKGYALWRNLHWLAVIGYFLMVWHVVAYQIKSWPLAPSLVLDFFLLLGLVAPALRYLVVDRGAGSLSFRVEQVNHPVHDVIDLHLAPTAGRMDIAPGQFVFARFMTSENFSGCSHFHPFTVSSVLDEGRLRLSIRAAGHCTRQMQTLHEGAEARLQGPFGHLFENARHESQVWIAGGIGITPFLARARMIDSHGILVKLFYLYETEGTAAFISELNAIAIAKLNFEFFPIATRGLIQIPLSVLDAVLPPWNDKEYVLCGPRGLTDPVRAYLGRNGVTPAQIHEERFDFR